MHNNKYGYLGILGALLMFAGDMILYFSTSTITQPYEDILRILGEMPFDRLVLGGIIGPIAACFYLCGFYFISQLIHDNKPKLRKLVFICFSMSIIVGSVYHSGFTFLGIAVKSGSTVHLKMVETALQYYLLFVLAGYLLGSILLGYAIIKNNTAFPKWAILTLPGILLFASSLWEHLPQPYFIVVAGGWYNIMFLLFFSVAISIARNNTLKNQSIH